MNDKKDNPDKKSGKKARPLTSGQLKAVVKKKAEKAEKLKPKGSDRLITVDVWGRGNSNPLMRAFISEHKTQRTVKRTASAWLDLFRKWKEKPRG